MTLNNKKCDCFDTKYEGSASWHPTEHKEGCSFATPKNSGSWEEPIRRVVIGALKSCKDAHGKVDVSSAEKRVTHALREPIQVLLQERSKDTVGSLTEKLGGRFYSLKLGTKRTGEYEISDWWYAEGVVDNGENPIKADGSSPLEALQKLSEQLNQK